MHQTGTLDISNFDLYKVPRDGSCFYHAACMALKNGFISYYSLKELSASLLRANTAAWMRGNPDFVICELPGGFRETLRNFSVDGVANGRMCKYWERALAGVRRNSYADAASIHAFACAHEVDVVVYSRVRGQPDQIEVRQICRPQSTQSPRLMVQVLIDWDSQHYDALIPREEARALPALSTLL